MQAMILAAGFGTRLRPYSLQRPKALFPVLNRPLLLATIDRLKAAGAERVMVNAHHLGGRITEALADLQGVDVQVEEVILGTGGGLRQALPRLDDGPLLVTNGDIYHDICLRSLYESHLAQGAPVTMALHHCPRFNQVEVDDGMIVGFGNDRPAATRLAYTGVQVVDPAFLGPLEPGRFSCIIDYYRERIDKGARLGYCRVDGCDWTDMGTPDDYLDLHGALLTGRRGIWPEIGCPGGPLLVSPGAGIASDVALVDWNCIGRATIGEGVRLARCVVWDGAAIPAGAQLEDQIVMA